MGEILKDLISLEEAARIAGKSKVTIWRWMKAGKLKGHTIADRVFVSRREAQRIAGKAKK